MITEIKTANRVKTLKASAIREIFKLLADPEIISFAGGAPSPTVLPNAELADICQKLLRNNPSALQYGVTEGFTPLRELLRDVSASSGDLLEGDDCVITTGGQQGLDLAFKSLVNEGDYVAVEQPSFIGGLNSLRSYNARLLPVPIEDDGMSIDHLEQLLKTNKIAAVYTIPTFQNPSGITMSLQKRKRLLELAITHDFCIVEDDPYSRLRFEGTAVPSIKSLDNSGRVVKINSFSKILSPGWRLGWAVGSGSVLEKMIVCKQISDVHTPVLNQMAAYEYISQFTLEPLIEKSVVLYREQHNAMQCAMDKYFPDYVKRTRTMGGIFIWCELPQGADSLELFKKAVENKVAFVPGSTCMADIDAKCAAFRLNYSLCGIQQIEQGIQTLGRLISN